MSFNLELNHLHNNEPDAEYLGRHFVTYVICQTWQVTEDGDRVITLIEPDGKAVEPPDYDGETMPPPWFTLCGVDSDGEPEALHDEVDAGKMIRTARNLSYWLDEEGISSEWGMPAEVRMSWQGYRELRRSR